MSLIPGSLRFIGTPATTDAPSNELICGIQEQSVKKGTRPCRENRFPASYRLRIDRRASQTIGGKEPGRRPSDPKSGSVLFGRICFRFREHDLIRSLIGFHHSSRSGVDSPSEHVEQIDDGNGVECFEDRKAHRIVSLRFDFDFRIRKSPLYSRFIGESVHLVFFAVDSQCRRFNGNVRIERDFGPRTAKNRGARREQDNGRYIQRKTSSRTPIFSAAKIPSILLKLGTHHFGVQHGHLRIESVRRKFRASAPAFPTPRNRPHRKEPERPRERRPNGKRLLVIGKRNVRRFPSSSSIVCSS